MEFLYNKALQINIYPLDFPHLRSTLKHQIKVWSEQVDSISVTLDIRRSVAGRYRSDQYDDLLDKTRTLLAELCQDEPKLIVSEVDYSSEMRESVAALFFNEKFVPDKAWDGGPYYSYFFGLRAASARYVFHIDGDMLFGGGSQSWMNEAIHFFSENPDVLFIAPLAGPPLPGGRSESHRLLDGNLAQKLNHTSLALEFDHVSTRVFLIDMERFIQHVVFVDAIEIGLLRKLKAFLLGHPRLALEAESVLSITMQNRKMCRVDIYGETPGMWSLHPPFRSEEYYANLPKIIGRIESGEIPEGQLGDHNLNDSFIDWSSARMSQTKTKRLVRQLKHVLRRCL